MRGCCLVLMGFKQGNSSRASPCYIQCNVVQYTILSCLHLAHVQDQQAITALVHMWIGLYVCVLSVVRRHRHHTSRFGVCSAYVGRWMGILSAIYLFGWTAGNTHMHIPRHA